MRKLFRNHWLNRAIVVVFVLWSGMFVRLLPAPDQRLTAAANGAVVVHRWHSDCRDGVAQTFCKSDGLTGALPNFPHVVGITSNLLYWTSTFIAIAPARIPLPVELRVSSIPIFIVICALLK